MDLEEQIKEHLNKFDLQEILEMNDITEEDLLKFLYNNGMIVLDDYSFEDVEEDV